MMAELEQALCEQGQRQWHHPVRATAHDLSHIIGRLHAQWSKGGGVRCLRRRAHCAQPPTGAGLA